MFSGGDDLTLRSKCFDLKGEDLINSCLSLAEECDRQQNEEATRFSLTPPGEAGAIVYDSYEECGQVATGVSAAFDASKLTGIKAKWEEAKGYFKAAKILYNDARYGDAITKLEQAYQLYPQPDVRNALVNAYRKFGETETDPKEKAKAYYKASYLWYQGKNYAEALADARQADSIVPNDNVKARIAELEKLVAPDPAQRIVKVATVADLPKLTAAKMNRPAVIVMIPRSIEQAQRIQDAVAAKESDTDVYVIDLDDAATATQLVAGFNNLGVSSGSTPTAIRLFKRNVDQAAYVQVDGQLEPQADYAFTPLNYSTMKEASDNATSAVLLVGDPLETYLHQKKIRKAKGSGIRYYILDPQQGVLVKMAESLPPRGFGINAPGKDETYRLYARAKGQQTWTWVDLNEATGKLEDVDPVTRDVLANIGEEAVRKAERSQVIILTGDAKKLYDRGDYDDAVVKYIQVYNIEPHYSFPWKIAECHARGGSYFLAVAFARYQRDHYPNSPLRETVDRKLAEWEEKLPKNPPSGPQVEKAMEQVARELERRQREAAAKRVLAAGGIELQQNMLEPHGGPAPAPKPVPGGGQPVLDESARIVAEALGPERAGSAVVADLENTRLASEAMKAGDEFYKQKRYEDALAKYDHALTLDSEGHRRALIGKAQCHQAMNRRAEAIAAYRAYLRVAPDASDRASIDAVISSLELPDRSPPPSDVAAETVIAAPAPVKAAAEKPATAAPDDPVAALVKKHAVAPDRFGFTYVDDTNVADAGNLEGAIVVIGEPDEPSVQDAQQQLVAERADLVTETRRHLFIPVTEGHQPKTTLKALGLPSSVLESRQGVYRVSKKKDGSWKADSYRPVGFRIIRSPDQAERYIANSAENLLILVAPSGAPELDEYVGQMRTAFVTDNATGTLPKVRQKKIDRLVFIEEGHVAEWSQADPRWTKLAELTKQGTSPQFLFATGRRSHRTYTVVDANWYTAGLLPHGGSAVAALSARSTTPLATPPPSIEEVLAAGRRFLHEACPVGGPCDEQKLESALIRFRIAVFTAPTDVLRDDAWIGVGRISFARREFDVAATLFRSVLERREKDADLWNLCGQASFHGGRFSSAAVAYAHVAELRPDDAEAFEHLGDAFAQKTNRKEEAITAYRQAAALWKQKNNDARVKQIEAKIIALGGTKQKTIAVLGFESPAPSTSVQDAFADAMTEGLRKKFANAGNNLATPKNLVEMKLVFCEGNDRPDCMARAGKSLRADELVYGTVKPDGKGGQEATITHLDVASGTVRQTATVTLPQTAEASADLFFQRLTTTPPAAPTGTQETPDAAKLGLNVAIGKLTAQAERAEKRRELPRAEELYRQVIAADPNNIFGILEVYLSLARLLKKQGRMADARPIYQRYAQLRPLADAQAHFEFGEVLEKLSASAEAQAAYSSCLVIEVTAHQPQDSDPDHVTKAEDIKTPLAHSCRTALERLTQEPASLTDPKPAGQRLFPFRDHIVALTPDNYRAAWQKLMTVFVTRDFESEAFRRMVNGESLPGPKGNSGGIAVINWDDPKGRQVAAHFDITTMLPTSQYYEYYFDGTIDAQGDFTGGAKVTPGDFLTLAELLGRQPDEQGYRFVTAANANKEIGSSTEFYAVVGTPFFDEELVRVQRDLKEDQQRVGGKRKNFWFAHTTDHPIDPATLRNYGINEVPTGMTPIVYRCKKVSGRWKAERAEPPLVTAHRIRDLRSYVHKTDKTVLYVIGPKKGPGSKETTKLLAALEKEIRKGKLTVEGKQVDRIVIMEEEELAEIYRGQESDSLYNLAANITRARPLVALSHREGENRYLNYNIPVDTLPGHVKTVELQK